MKVEGTNFWQTNELLIATVLRCYGLSPVELFFDADANSTYWRFYHSTDLMSVVTQFSLGRCRVEPQAFNSYYVGLKDEMFKFMRDEGVRPRERARR